MKKFIFQFTLFCLGLFGNLSIGFTEFIPEVGHYYIVQHEGKLGLYVKNTNEILNNINENIQYTDANFMPILETNIQGIDRSNDRKFNKERYKKTTQIKDLGVLFDYQFGKEILSIIQYNNRYIVYSTYDSNASNIGEKKGNIFKFDMQSSAIELVHSGANALFVNAATEQYLIYSIHYKYGMDGGQIPYPMTYLLDLNNRNESLFGKQLGKLSAISYVQSKNGICYKTISSRTIQCKKNDLMCYGTKEEYIESDTYTILQLSPTIKTLGTTFIDCNGSMEETKSQEDKPVQNPQKSILIRIIQKFSSIFKNMFNR